MRKCKKMLDGTLIFVTKMYSYKKALAGTMYSEIYLIVVDDDNEFVEVEGIILLLYHMFVESNQASLHCDAHFSWLALVKAQIIKD